MIKRKYQKFIFESYTFDQRQGLLSLRYSFDGKIFFTERLIFPKQGMRKLPQQVLDQAFANLHLVAGLSYYKAYCPHEIIVKSQILSSAQARFWQKLYTKGLGEFFYQNKINFRELIKFPSASKSSAVPNKLQISEHILLPAGGGKDSLLSAALLQKAKLDFTIFSLNEHAVLQKTAKFLGKKQLTVKRELDPLLFELNAQGAWNGHVPITAYLSFLLVTCGVLYGYKYLPLSLEHSANFGQVFWQGVDINHQYSKSYEFERDLSKYLEQFFSPDIKIFSLLRPFHEIKIAKLFAAWPGRSKFDQLFTSCNTNFKIKQTVTKRWCGTCPKCVFVFSILAPFIERTELVKIFEQDLFANPKLLPLFRRLSGLRGIKPFECVGTADEMQVALYFAGQKKDYRDEAVLKTLLPELKLTPAKFKALQKKVFKNYPANLPTKFESLIKKI